MENQRIQTTFRVDVALLKKFKHALLERGTRMTPVIEGLIRDWLQGYSYESGPAAVLPQVGVKVPDDLPHAEHSGASQIQPGLPRSKGDAGNVAIEKIRNASGGPIEVHRIEGDVLFENLAVSPRNHNLRPDYLFENFVVGASNQFAHAAARAVAEQPSKAYNPLFLYGGVGMGKTHLMQAIGHLIAKRDPAARVTYISAEQFTNEVINSLRFDRMTSLRDRFRSVDVLLVDDIQFIAGKERTQEEFFHTFNALYDLKRQIVISSDCPPKEISAIEKRLRSRFEWGLIADIQPPGLETKIAILQKRARLERVTLPDDVAEYIARAVKSNVRELEGALTRLIAYSSLTGSVLNLATAQQVLSKIIVTERKGVTIELIQKNVAEEFGLRERDLKVRSNTKAIAFPRQIAMYLVRQLTSASLPETGRWFGGKHPSTVLHSVNRIEELRRSDKDLNKALNKIIDRLMEA